MSRHRRRLTEDLIVQTARELARTEGLEALTMRRLAHELHTSAMSLYRHIPDRQGLLLLMLDNVARGLTLPPVATDPRAELQAIAQTMHETFTREPWVVLAIANHGLASPLILPLMERAYAALYAAGHTGRAVNQAWMRLFQFLYGEALASQLDSARTVSGDIVRAADPARYPALGRALTEFSAAPAEDDFIANLSHLLDTMTPPI